MIERFYEPKEGEIYIDGSNIKEIRLKELREGVGFVSQEPVLIIGSVKDNLLFGNKDASKEEIEHAVK